MGFLLLLTRLLHSINWKELVYIAQYLLSSKLVFHSKHNHSKILCVWHFTLMQCQDRCYRETFILKCQSDVTQVPWLCESQASSSVAYNSNRKFERNRWKWGFPVPHWRALSLDHRTSLIAHLMTCQEPGHYLWFIHARCSPEGLTAAVSRSEISAVLLRCSAANLTLIWLQRTSWYCCVTSLPMTVNV